MSFSINYVILVGNVVHDVYSTIDSNGVNLATIILATNRNINRNGRLEDVGTTHKIVAWDKVADFAQKSLKVGDRVCIEARLDTRTTIDELGKEQKLVSIVAKNIIPMSPAMSR